MEMILEQLINHIVQLKETEIVEIDAKKFHDLQQQEHIDIVTRVKGEICNEKEGYSYIQIELKPTSESFRLRVIVRGKFLSETAVESKKYERFLLAQGVTILWSYAREIIYDITGKMLRNAYLLPTLDVVKTLAKAKVQNGDEQKDAEY